MKPQQTQLALALLHQFATRMVQEDKPGLGNLYAVIRRIRVAEAEAAYLEMERHGKRMSSAVDWPEIPF